MIIGNTVVMHPGLKALLTDPRFVFHPFGPCVFDRDATELNFIAEGASTAGDIDAQLREYGFCEKYRTPEEKKICFYEHTRLTYAGGYVDGRNVTVSIVDKETISMILAVHEVAKKLKETFKDLSWSPESFSTMLQTYQKGHHEGYLKATEKLTLERLNEVDAQIKSEQKATSTVTSVRAAGKRSLVVELSPNARKKH